MYGMHHSSISQDLMTFGNEAVGVHHSIQARLDQAGKHDIITNIRIGDGETGIRNRMGTLMISLGILIAGKTSTIQDRQATMPVPKPKTGFVPTP